ERERGRLAGGAQHVESVAAVGQQVMGERGRARAIGLAVGVNRGRDRRDDAAEVGCAHGGHPLTLKAASAAMLTRWESFGDSDTICAGRSSPTRIGPITVAPPSSCSILVEIEAEWNAGMISTFAGPDRRQNG